MTAQYEVIDGLPEGLTLTAKMFDADTPDTEVSGNTFGIVEGTNAKGRYVITITRASVLPAGDYTTRLFLGSSVIAVADRRFAGTDGETASDLPTTAELDSASLIRFVTEDTGETSAAAGSVAKLAQGSGGSGSSDWTSDERAAIRTILGIPASGTTPADPTTGILDNIRDLVVAYIAAALATVNGTTGTIVGFPATLNIGDSYTDDCNSSIHVFIRDENDDPVSAVGTHDFIDADFAPECTITQNGSVGRVKCEVEYVTASPESYLKIQIPSKESRRATPGIATVQVLLKWDGAQKALSKQTVTWEALI